MHGTGSSLRETASIQLYLDESGGGDTATAVLGGMLINYGQFHSFEDTWQDTLERYSIPWPLHMKDFSKHGPLGHIPPICRFELLSELTQIINDHKIYSVVAKVRSHEYESNVDEYLRGHFGLYGMCFILAVVMNQRLASLNRYSGRIAYILDVGNSKTHHVVGAHSEIIKMQTEEKEYNWRAGDLHFEDDRDFALLQAADLIAWGARRKEDKAQFPSGMEPIRRFLNEDSVHVEKYFEPDLMKEMSDKIMAAHRKMLADQHDDETYE